ncbi:MAG: VWA domain-containing protein [Chloroflexi bacterium]|nr:VWA domain-containing protein [Chloroflexota bacterium]
MKQVLVFAAVAVFVLLAAAWTLGWNGAYHVVVVLSDGRDTVSKRSLADAHGAATAAGVPIFALGLLSSDYDRVALEVLAGRSGGEVLETATPEGLLQLYRRVGAKIKERYRLLVRFDWPPGQPTVDLRLRVGAGQSSLQFDRVLHR